MISLFASLAKPAAGGFTSIHPSLVLSSWAFSLARHSFSDSSSVRGGLNIRLRDSVGILRMALIFLIILRSPESGALILRVVPEMAGTRRRSLASARSVLVLFSLASGRHSAPHCAASGHPLTSLLPHFPFSIIVHNRLEVLDKGWRILSVRFDYIN